MAVTRLGLYGGSRGLYGNFSLKVPDEGGDSALAIFYRRRHRRWWPLPKH